VNSSLSYLYLPIIIASRFLIPENQDVEMFELSYQNVWYALLF